MEVHFNESAKPEIIHHIIDEDDDDSDDVEEVDIPDMHAINKYGSKYSEDQERMFSAFKRCQKGHIRPLFHAFILKRTNTLYLPNFKQ